MEPSRRDDPLESGPTSFAAFWPYYVGEHADPLTRRLHCLGTGLAIGCLIGSLFVSAWLLILVPIVGYGFAWASHLLIEKNRPATFRYPLWSLLGDLKMFRLMLLGRMNGEIQRLKRDRDSHDQVARPG